MNEYKPVHLDKQTTDGAEMNLEALYQLFPSCFTEAKDAITGETRRVVDWSKLRSLLGDYVEDGEPERYDFTWVGKRAAQREAAAPCRKTLRPCPEESVDWDTTQNLYIEGDNLEVLKLLQNSYMGKVKMIYIDPPYNTGNDFVYHDDFAQSVEEYDEHNKDDEGNRYRKNTDSNGRFHSDWCSMIYTRLMVARSFLAEDGVVFISIDDSENYNMIKICNEVFGESNYITCFSWVNSLKDEIDEDTKFAGSNLGTIKKSHEYILVYAMHKFKMSLDFSTNPYIIKLITNGGNAIQKLKLPKGIRCEKEITKVIKGHVGGKSDYYDILTKEGMIFEKGVLMNDVEIEGPLRNPLMLTRFFNGERVIDNKGQELVDVFSSDSGMLHTKKLRAGNSLSTVLVGKGTTKNGTLLLKELFGATVFDYAKPVELIEYLISKQEDNDFIVLDFFSGSATTAHATMLNNIDYAKKVKYILVQIQEEINPDKISVPASKKIAEAAISYLDAKNLPHLVTELAKERIRLSTKKIKKERPLDSHELDIGFRVFKCDESNYKNVAFAPKDYKQGELDMLLDNIKDERTGLDLLFDCMLRWGLELSLPYTEQKVDKCTIYNVDEGNLVACFDGEVTEAVIDAIAQANPVRVVFRDSSFTEAAQKMNLFELFKQKCNWTDQEVKNNVRVI